MANLRFESSIAHINPKGNTLFICDNKNTSMWHRLLGQDERFALVFYLLDVCALVVLVSVLVQKEHCRFRPRNCPIFVFTTTVEQCHTIQFEKRSVTSSVTWVKNSPTPAGEDGCHRWRKNIRTSISISLRVLCNICCCHGSDILISTRNDLKNGLHIHNSVTGTMARNFSKLRVPIMIFFVSSRLANSYYFGKLFSSH